MELLNLQKMLEHEESVKETKLWQSGQAEQEHLNHIVHLRNVVNYCLRHGTPVLRGFIDDEGFRKFCQAVYDKWLVGSSHSEGMIDRRDATYLAYKAGKDLGEGELLEKEYAIQLAAIGFGFMYHLENKNEDTEEIGS